MSVTEFFRYLFAFDSSTRLAAELSAVYRADVAAQRRRAARTG